MSYKLHFRHSALKEWEKLDGSIREQFKKKLKERLVMPHVPSAKLSGLESAYKIKLRKSGYRLVYTVEEAIVTVTVVTVGRRDGGEVYDTAMARLR